MSFASVTVLTFLVIALPAISAQDDGSEANSTTVISKKLFTYSGPLLPSDWSVVSIVNDRAIIGFNNGTARNSLLDELPQKDKSFIQRLQNGTVYSTPLSSTKEKLAQWTSQFTTTVSKLSKSLKDQFDSLINKNSTTQSTTTTTSAHTSNGTIIVQ